MLSKYTYLFLICIIATSCLTDPVTLELSDIKSTSSVTPLPFSGLIVFVQDNDIYMMDSITYKNPKRLTFTPSVPKSMLTLSYGRNKVAYLSNNGTTTYPVIIDTAGNVLVNLPDEDYVSAMCWNNDGSSLVIRQGTYLSYYGTSLSLNLPFLHYTNGYYFGFAMSRNKDLAYSYNYTFSNSDYNKIDFVSGSTPDRTGALSTTKYTERFQFSNNADKLLVANRGYGSDYGIETVYLCNFSDFSRTYVYDGDFLNPLADITLTADGNHTIYSYVSQLNSKYVLIYEEINTSNSSKVFYSSTGRITSIDCR